MSELTLTDFLLARIVERERWAQAIIATVDVSRGAAASIVHDHPDLAMGDCPSYIADFDAEFVLTECEAKRRIVEMHAITFASAGDEAWGTNPECGTCCSWPCPTLQVLTLPYADHPDYRESWRP